MNTNKTKKSQNTKLSLKNLKSLKQTKKNKVKGKGCFSCSSSSSSSSCSSSSSSSCCSGLWSSCSSSSYKSCSISSDSCNSSSSSDGSCKNRNAKTLTLGNKYITIGTDQPTLKFDPSKCNTLSAPTYPMGFSLASVVNGVNTNQVVMLGSNQTSNPYVELEPRVDGSGNLIAPNTYLVFPSVSSTSTVVDLNGVSRVSNDQALFTGLDNLQNVTGIFSTLGEYSIAKHTTTSNYTQTAILGARSFNFGNTLSQTIIATGVVNVGDVANTVYVNSPSTITVTLNLLPTMLNGDMRYIDCVHSNNVAINYSFTYNGTGASTVAVNGTNSNATVVTTLANAPVTFRARSFVYGGTTYVTISI